MPESYLTLRQVLNNASNDDLHELLKFFNGQWNSSVSKRAINVTEANREARIRLIEKEIREYGGNTLINIFRSEPVKYDEIVQDVAKKFSIKTEKLMTPDLEAKIYCKIAEKMVEKMSEEDRIKLFRELNIKVSSTMSDKDITAILSRILLGDSIVSYRLMSIILGAVWHYILGAGIYTGGLAVLGFGGTAAFLFNPIGMVIASIWTGLELSGPAYRVTIPCVLYIAMLRRKPKA